MNAADEFIEMINDMSIEELKEVQIHAKKTLRAEAYSDLGSLIGDIRRSNPKDERVVRERVEKLFIKDLAA